MSSEKKWLVKSNDHILGPFLFDHVVENIFKGETHLLDEIKGPFERWRPIKDHSLFAAAIERLKATTFKKREMTVTGTIDLETKTSELTKSQTLTKSPSFTKTPKESFEDDELENSNDIADVYGPQNNTKNKSKSLSVFIMTFVVFIFAGIGYLLYEFNETKLVEQKVSAFNQLTDQALTYLKVGEYHKALKNFSMAYNISPSDAQLIIEMSPLSVQFDGQFSQVEILLSGLLATNYNKDYVKRGKNIIGLTHSYRANYEEALKRYDEVLSLEPNFLPSLLNKAFVLIKLKRPEEAVTLMQKVVKDNPDQPVAHYIYIKSLIESGLKKKDQEQLKEAVQIIKYFSQKFSDFKQEVLFLSALANLHLEMDKAEFLKQVKNFMEVDFELTNLHVHDPQFDFQSFNWLDTVGYCQEMAGALDHYSSKLLEGFCLLKINRTIEAKKIFENLLSQKGNDGILQALYTSALLKLEDLSQAKNALGFIDQVDQKQPIVETLLRGCLVAEDLSCAEALFKGKHAKHISLLYSHWGNGEIHFESHLKQSKSSIQLGLQLSPHFSPLLKLKNKL